jgi:hypothetical protein
MKCPERPAWTARGCNAAKVSVCPNQGERSGSVRSTGLKLAFSPESLKQTAFPLAAGCAKVA